MSDSSPRMKDQNDKKAIIRRRRRRSSSSSRCRRTLEPSNQQPQLSEPCRNPPTRNHCFKSFAIWSLVALCANRDHIHHCLATSPGFASAWTFAPSLPVARPDGTHCHVSSENHRRCSSRNYYHANSKIRSPRWTSSSSPRSRHAFYANQMYRDHNDGEQRRRREKHAKIHKEESWNDCEQVPAFNSSVALEIVDNNNSSENFPRQENHSPPFSPEAQNSTKLSLALDSLAKEWEGESTRAYERKRHANENASHKNQLSTSANSTATVNNNENNNNGDRSNATTSSGTTSVNHHDNLRCLCDGEDYIPLLDEDELDTIFEDLMAKVERYNPGAIDIYTMSDVSQPPTTVEDGSIVPIPTETPHPSPSVPLLQRAYYYAKSAHRGQCRKSGEPYITHPLGVANIIADMKLDLPSLVTALLHDTVEDTPVTLSDISTEFGREISRLVDGVTKVGRLPFSSSEELQSENYRKLILAMAKDIRVVLVKLADRAHNMRTLQYMTPEKQRKIAQETMDIYAPLAHRLGIHWLKTELEDNCFRYLYPEEYQKLLTEVKGREEERKEYEREVVEILKRQMLEAGVGRSGSMEKVNGGNGSMDQNTATLLVTGRTKGLWSIYTKMKRQEIEFDDVHDVVGFRIIVDDVASCYQALGVVHSHWKPVPGKIKDYVALPKPNGYRSLHTTIIGPHQRRIEVQIRTREMHEVAESGIAAHFLYKEKNHGSTGGNKSSDESTRFAWLRELVNEVRRQSDPIEFVNAVKEDLFLKEVLVFSPGGDLYALPRGSSVLDFAFKVHSDLGYHCAGAKVNGKMVSLKHQIKNGDMIEILESIHQTPKREWLQYVRTSKAKNRIRAWLKRRQREHSIVVGKEIINRGLKEYNPRGDDTAAKKEYSRKLDHVLNTFKLRDEKHLFTALGYGQISIKNVMTEVFGAAAIATRGHSHSMNKKEKDDQFVIQSLENSAPSSINPQLTSLSNLNGIIVGQERNIMLKFCKNCTPLEGEKIQGVISKGKGVKIHRLGCKYLLEADEKRIVDVRWDDETINKSFRPVQLQVLCEDTPGVLANMSRAITTSGFNIGNVHLRKLSNGRGLARLEVMLKSLEDLENVTKRLRQEDGILDVTRR